VDIFATAKFTSCSNFYLSEILYVDSRFLKLTSSAYILAVDTFFAPILLNALARTNPYPNTSTITHRRILRRLDFSHQHIKAFPYSRDKTKN